MKRTYKCEECKKEFEAEYNKFSHWTRCECGGRAFDTQANLRTTPMTKL
jgi:DNA-directed RNA polymerase subunit RPC12/RpoP